MNRNDLRRARALLGRVAAKDKPWTPWEWCDLRTADFVPPGLLRACKNNAYIVQFHKRTTPFGVVDHLLIQTLDGAPLHKWSHFQRIKNELCGPEREAVEIYPPQFDLIDDFNVYHLWVLPPGTRIGFGLRLTNSAKTDAPVDTPCVSTKDDPAEVPHA